MGYLVTIAYLKSVDEWDPEQGAAGHSRDIDHQQLSKDFTDPVSRDDIDHLIKKKYYLTLDDARHDPEEDGRFLISQIEDEDGAPDPNGKWLADYDLRITIMKTSSVKVGALGTPSF